MAEPNSNPVLVEVTRGGRVESWHRGAVAVVGADGQAVISLGDVKMPVYPRSSIKLFQAIPLVASGAADAFGFDDRMLALACASHGGEPGHVELAAEMLRRTGGRPDDLECGPHWPSHGATARTMTAAGETPVALHNNCSGKHAGMVAVARHLGEPVTGYTSPVHPVQRRICDLLARATGVALEPRVCGIDGCSAPNWTAPLSGLAYGFARAATGQGLAAKEAKAASRLMRACMVEPWFVAGTGRSCTALMRIAPGRIFVKTGAEGVFCGALPELGLGIALKIDDGATRASEIGIATVLAKLLPDLGGLAQHTRHQLENWRGTHVGDIRPAPVLAELPVPATGVKG